MISAKLAREVTSANIEDTFNVKILPEFIKKAEECIKTFSQKGKSECLVVLSPNEEKYEYDLVLKIGSYGYSCKFIPAEAGDPREMLDYGSPAYIKITW